MGLLQDAITQELPLLRSEAEARMTDVFDVKIAVGTTYDKDAQAEVTVYDSLFTTVGRVKVGGGLAAQDAEVGGRTSVEVRRELHIPVGSQAVPPDAVAFCTAIGAMSDPTLLGAGLRIVGPAPGSQMTARRLQVSEVLT